MEDDVFTRCAGEGYDLIMRSLAHRQQVQRLLAMAGVRSGMRIVDFGFGGGIILPGLQSLRIQAQVVGVDNSKKMVELAEPKIAGYRQFGGEVTIIEADLNEPASNWGLEDLGKFDAALAIHLLYALASPWEFLTAAATVLQPDAALAFATPSSPPSRATMQAVYEEHARLAFPEPGSKRDQERSKIAALFKQLEEINLELASDPTKHYPSRTELAGWIDPVAWPNWFIGEMFGIPVQNHAGVLFAAVL